MVNIPCRIQVAVMLHATPACPNPIRQREVGLDPAARAARFRGGKEAPNRHHSGIVPVSLVFQHQPKHAPTRIEHTRRQLGFRKATNAQIFNRNEVVVTHQLRTQLVQKVGPLTLDLLVDASHDEPRLAPAPATLHFPAERLLGTPQFTSLRAIPAWVRNGLTRRIHRQ